jgi:hypothetical protein
MEWLRQPRPRWQATLIGLILSLLILAPVTIAFLVITSFIGTLVFYLLGEDVSWNPFANPMTSITGTLVIIVPVIFIFVSSQIKSAIQDCCQFKCYQHCCLETEAIISTREEIEAIVTEERPLVTREETV